MKIDIERFKSERLYLREFEKNDFELFYSVFSNEQVMKYTLIDVLNEEEGNCYFEKVLKNNYSYCDRKAFEFAVFTNSNNDFIGFADIEIHSKNSDGGCGEIGYFILPAFWGKGMASEAASVLLDICFTGIKLHRVSASCNSKNTQSEKVMLKIGMHKEGEFRKVRYKNGCWDNELRYSILLEEWNKK